MFPECYYQRLSRKLDKRYALNIRILEYSQPTMNSSSIRPGVKRQKDAIVEHP